MSPGDALHEGSIYSSPEIFRPTRWLPEENPLDSPQRKYMDMAFVPFNRGPRACIGLK